jgi:hypothetical protein
LIKNLHPGLPKLHRFTLVIRGSIQLDQNDQYGLKVNVIAAQILDAAGRSGKEGKTVVLKQD